MCSTRCREPPQRQQWSRRAERDGALRRCRPDCVSSQSPQPEPLPAMASGLPRLTACPPPDSIRTPWLPSGRPARWRSSRTSLVRSSACQTFSSSGQRTSGLLLQLRCPYRFVLRILQRRAQRVPVGGELTREPRARQRRTQSPTSTASEYRHMSRRQSCSHGVEVEHLLNRAEAAACSSVRVV